MIPKTASDLDALVDEARRQKEEVGAIFDELSPQQALVRSDPKRWSATGHVAHLGIINARYLDAAGSALDRALQAGGPRSDGPYRHPRVAAWFVGSMEPPPRRRLKTFRSMVPDPEATPDGAVADFARLQDRMAGMMERARGLDLGRIRFGSPFFGLLRFSLGTGFEMLLAHNRRHIWLVCEVLDAPGS